ncbi:MAG: TIGR02996 domain-containing protein [Kofleriaceae bacterium]
MAAGDDRIEADFLVALGARPGDHEVRGVYADWLEQHRSLAKADFVRLDGHPDPDIAGETDVGWRAVTSRTWIEQCRRDGCPELWDGLEPTGDERVRRCANCDLGVRYCATRDEEREAHAAGMRSVRDVAIDGRIVPDTQEIAMPVSTRDQVTGPYRAPVMCGTGQRAADEAGMRAQFRRALRLRARGRLVEALALVDADLVASFQPGLDGCSQPEVAEIHARLLEQLGRLDEAQRARARYRIDLAERAATLPATGAGDYWHARTLHKRGMLAYVEHDLAAAERELRAAIAMIAAQWGADHLEAVSYEDDLATVLLHAGRAAEADALIAHVRSIEGTSYDTE